MKEHSLYHDLPNAGVHSSLVDAQNKSILLDSPVDNYHDNKGDDEEEKKDYVDSCMVLSSSLCKHSLLFISPG